MNVGWRKGEPGGREVGGQWVWLNSPKPKGNLVIVNCPAWALVAGLSLFQWGFSDSHTEFLLKVLFLKRNYSTLHWWQCGALIRHSWHGSGKASEAGHLLGVRSLLTQWWAHRGCNSPPRLSSDDRSLLKAPGTLLPTSIYFPGSVVKFVWLHLILKNLRNDRQETEIAFHVRYISSEQRIKWTLYQWEKHFFCLLWFPFPNSLLVEVN